MSTNTKIGWADDSVNLWWGCVEVSSEPKGGGCDNCYARELSKRFGHDVWGNDKPRRMLPNAFKQLDKSQALAVKEGKRRRVFVNSMSDLAETLPPTHPNWGEVNRARDVFFRRIDDWPDLDLIWLTKRIGNVAKIVPPAWLDGAWPENLWLVPTIVNQYEYERDLPKLHSIPAKVKGLSVEPMLGPLSPGVELGSLDWVIIGGESGPKRRPMELEWMVSLEEHCRTFGVPVFIKQDTALKDGQQGRIPDGLWARKEFPVVKA